MADQLKEPTPPDVICTLCDPPILLCICKCTAHDQPQCAMDEFPLEISKHVGIRIYTIVFVVKLFDQVWQLWVNCETCGESLDNEDLYCWKVSKVVG